MKTIMTLDKLTTPDQLACFLDGSQVCAYEVISSPQERYDFIKKTLVQFHYHRLSKGDKGIVIRYLMKLSGYSRQQLTRLIKQHKTTRTCVRKQQTRRGFSRRYTQADILLLVETDELFDTRCGAITKTFCERALAQGDARYERLATISASHIYNLRRSQDYQQKRRHFTKHRQKIVDWRTSQTQS
ncbi:MAG: hypothetical protein HC782_05740 [Gammaproteobacteria bacterium]|nr:hypothetical protein [Gammaproteobacteria bacterium]